MIPVRPLLGVGAALASAVSLFVVSSSFAGSAISPSGPVVEIVSPNDDQVIRRDLCLRIAAGKDADYECGDLRISHPLPATTTMGKTRMPILTYNSQHANPFVVLAADVTRPAGTAQPDSVYATLWANGATQATGVWNGSEWSAGETRRISLGYDAISLETGVYSHTLEVTFHRREGAVVVSDTATAKRKVPIINRSDSPFGAGWWLAGLEMFGVDQLVGGDGSSRYFNFLSDEFVELRGLAAGDPDFQWPETFTWPVTSADHSEELILFTYAPALKWLLPGGDTIVFGGDGEHVATVNRYGHRTEFVYEDSIVVPPLRRLTEIRLPVVNGSAPTYTFEYNGTDSSFSRVIAPGGRVTDIENTGGKITAIEDPGLPPVVFGYHGRRITSRTDRRQFTTKYSYGDGFRLTEVRVDSAGLDLTTSFTPAETRGYSASSGTPGASLPVDSAYTLLDGPRSDLDDHTRFYVNPYGSVDRVRNALDEETTLRRDNPAFPALVTEVEHPNGYREQAEYDARGNLTHTLQINPYGAGDTATTRYQYGEGPLADVVERIVRPEGDSTVFRYRADRTLEWVQPGEDASRRWTYSFQPDTRLLESVVAPDSSLQQFEFDGWGNLKHSISPANDTTVRIYDEAGRPRDEFLPLPGGLKFQRTHTYNAAGRLETTRDTVPETVAIGFRSFFAPNVSLAAGYYYDAEGNLELGGVGGGQITSYDAVGRPEFVGMEGALPTQNFYDPAGNLEMVITGRGDTITMKYDPLNRLIERVVPQVTYAREHWCDFHFATSPFLGPEYCQQHRPYFPAYPNAPDGTSLRILADTATFSYDSFGNIQTAGNRNAQVRRGYYPSGFLRADTLVIQDYNVASSGVHDLSDYTYALESRYDLNGRRTELLHDTLSRSVVYDSITGELRTVTDIASRAHTYEHDRLGRLKSVSYPNGIAETYEYDVYDRVVSRSSSGSTAAGFLNYTLTRDLRGKIETASTPTNLTTIQYDNFGAVVKSDTWSALPGNPPVVEEFATTGANQVLGRRWGRSSNTVTFPEYLYMPGPNGRIEEISGGDHCNLTTCATEGTEETTRNYFDDDGNTYRTAYQKLFVGQYITPELLEEEGTRSYWGADGTLRYTQRFRRHHEPSPVLRDGEFVEYRYDALGRRIQVETRRSHGELCSGTCPNQKTRFVWDGSQVLLEERGSSTVHYTHGLGIDRPLSLIRNGEAFTPHVDWRGLHFEMTRADGAKFCANSNPCPLIIWPGQTSRVYKAGFEQLRRAEAWYGSLIIDQAEPSGEMYRRNRYYDPESGTFTQPDPIGIAGGLNLYGYAGGDPINFSDPFGLCIEEDELCWSLVEFLREFDGETLNDAADRLAKYAGRVFVQEDYPYSGGINATRMVLNMGASMEVTPEGSRLITPRTGDLAMLLVHETLHLAQDGSFPGLSHPPFGPFHNRQLSAFFEMNPVTAPAPIFLNRLKMRRGWR